MLSHTLDHTVALLGLDPEATEQPPETPLPPMPDWLEQEQVWRLAPADCACTGLCVCEQWVTTMSAADYRAAQAGGALAHTAED
ncbi:MAG: hypothetical protein M3P04_03370, partial [Actinomycetota bacterium]|nr:hypothetical protein [Actinomycetota bacterium]